MKALALALLLAACGSKVYDPTVRVQLSVASDVPEYLRRDVAVGGLFWDVVGAAVRTDDAPQVLPVVLSHCHGATMEYRPEGVIAIDMRSAPGYDDIELGAIAAHEIGHAFGLEHHSGDAVMNPHVPHVQSLRVDDVDQFQDIWRPKTN